MIWKSFYLKLKIYKIIMIIVYVTFSSLYEAKDLSTKLLDEKIIACFNTFPIQWAYLWMWEIKNSNEIVSLLKTRKDN